MMRKRIVYRKRIGDEEAAQRHGETGWSPNQHGDREKVFAVETDEGLIWCNRRALSNLRKQAERGAVYACRRSLKKVSPKPGAVGYLHINNSSERRRVMFSNGQWTQARPDQMKERMPLPALITGIGR